MDKILKENLKYRGKRLIDMDRDELIEAAYFGLMKYNELLSENIRRHEFMGSMQDLKRR